MFPDPVDAISNLTKDVQSIDAVSLVLVTARDPASTLYFEMAGIEEEKREELPFTLERIGDCLAPSTIAAAVYHGHRYARELDLDIDRDGVPFRREYAVI